MFDTGTAMPAFTKDPYLIYKITLLQKVLFLIVYKDIVPTTICMKSSIFTAVVLLLAAFKPCLTTKAKAVPVCIQQRIAEIKKEPKWNPPAEVHEYIYNGKKVYYFSSNCCDQYNNLVDSDCQVICAPSGGITGKGDGKCNDFTTVAKHTRQIWKDDR